MQMRVREKERVKEKWLKPEWTIGKEREGEREGERDGEREGERLSRETA